MEKNQRYPDDFRDIIEEGDPRKLGMVTQWIYDAAAGYVQNILKVAPARRHLYASHISSKICDELSSIRVDDCINLRYLVIERMVALVAELQTAPLHRGGPPRSEEAGPWSMSAGLGSHEGLSNEDLMFWYMSRELNLPSILIIQNNSSGYLTIDQLENRLRQIDKLMQHWQRGSGASEVDSDKPPRTDKSEDEQDDFGTDEV